MKNFILFLVIIFSSLSAWSERTHQISNGLLSGFCISDSLLNKSVAWDVTKRWVATRMDSKNGHIVYENINDGIIIIKGRYKDTDNRLFCVQYNFIVPYVNYELEINISEGSYCAKYNKIVYEPIVGYGDAPYGLKKILNHIINEMDEIKKLMILNGEEWEIDNSFQVNAEKLDKELKEADHKKDDKTISKKERKQYKKYYEDNSGRPSVYSAVNHAQHNLVFNTLLLNNNLESIILSTMSNITE